MDLPPYPWLQKERLEMDIEKTNKTQVEISLPDNGEEGSAVTLILPGGEKVELVYNPHFGSLEICTYRKSENNNFPNGYDSYECDVTCWTDKKDNNGKYISSMRPAPQTAAQGAHCRQACQIIIGVSKNQDN